MLQRPFRQLLTLRSLKFPKTFIPPSSIRTRASTIMSTTKKARTHPQYELLYWGGKMPGRGEFIRLAFEAAGVSYKDVSNEEENGTATQTT